MAQSSLESINQAFHDGYDQVVREATQDGPVFVVSTECLVAFRRGRRSEHSLCPNSFHDIKAVAHAPVAFYGMLHRLGAGELAPVTIQALVTLQAQVSKSYAELLARRDALASAAWADLEDVLQCSLEYLRVLCATGQNTADELDAFARSMGPALLRLAAHATQVQLLALDAQVSALLNELDESERLALQVVVTGDHQARKRSLAMQYFRKLLREPENSEERVSYGEGIDDERSALELVGKRRVDMDLALAFFGDRKRLQRDILGDAAQHQLEQMAVLAGGDPQARRGTSA